MTPPLADDQAMLIIPTEGDPPEGVVRYWVALALAGLPLVPRLRTELVVAELVANAYRHGEFPCVLRLSLDHTQRHLLVFVEDSATGGRAAWPPGAGLALVDGLTSSWGVRSRSRGKTVWAEIPLGARVAGITSPPQPTPET